MFKTYKELSRLVTFKERFEYLKLGGAVGAATFGFDRYINQALYHSYEWRKVRGVVIIRDDACDLGIQGHDLFGGVIVHHINPITVENIECGDDCVFDPNNLICVSLRTHNAIHYGDASLLPSLPKVRTKGDTTLWRAY